MVFESTQTAAVPLALPVTRPAASRIWIRLAPGNPGATWASSMWWPSGAHAIGQPERAATALGATGPDEPAEPGLAEAVACGWGVAPPPPDDSVAGEPLGPVTTRDPDADGCELACPMVAEGEGLSDRVATGESLVEGCAGISCGKANASPRVATRRMAVAAGATRRNSKPAAKPPRTFATRRRAGRLTGTDAGSVV